MVTTLIEIGAIFLFVSSVMFVWYLIMSERTERQLKQQDGLAQKEREFLVFKGIMENIWCAVWCVAFMISLMVTLMLAVAAPRLG